MSSTLRLFVNDNRISTAVPTKNGGIFQVYPMKKQFSNEVAWRAHWDEAMKPKIILKISHDEEDTRTFVGNWETEPKAVAVAETKPALAATQVIAKPKKAYLAEWTHKTHDGTFTYTLPSGDYYIGDLCYVLGDDVYDNIFGGEDYNSGSYVEKKTGRTFLVAHTAFGDGLYPASDGKEFAVDAGSIGICSASLMAKNDGGGYVYTFDKPVTCKFGHGRFVFNWGYYSLEIDTTGYDDEY